MELFLKDMNFLIFRDFFRIFTNFFEFILNLFGFSEIKEIKKIKFLLGVDMAADVVVEWRVATCRHVYMPHGARVCTHVHTCVRARASVISGLRIH